MNKVKFNKIVRNYYQVPDTDRVQLEKLAAEYPYSQVIHTLVAKSHHDAGTELAASTLHYAAMYTTDRNQLRHIIESKQPVLTEQPAGEDVLQKQETDKVMANLKTLKANREAYEKMIASESTGTSNSGTSAKKVTKPGARKPASVRKRTPAKSTATDNRKKTAESTSRARTTTKKDPKAEKNSKTGEAKAPVKKRGRPKSTSAGKAGTSTSKKPTAAESKKRVAGKVAAASTAASKKASATRKKSATTREKSKKDVPTSKKKTVAKKKSDPLPEIRDTGKKNSAGEDQRVIIEEFIVKQPSMINKVRADVQNQEDLSEKSTRVNEDLASENLAQIYLNQGKKTKALEIYKKLIWKFPQKKAYFAARIEELNKKG